VSKVVQTVNVRGVPKYYQKFSSTLKYNISQLFQVETDISEITKRVNELAGIKESDTGLGPPALWDLAADKQTLQSEQPLQVKLHMIVCFKIWGLCYTIIRNL